MKIVHLDIKKGEARLKIENLDDLWYASQIIDTKDFVSGSTIRKIKIGETDSRNTKVIKKRVFLTLEVEKVEFHKHSDILRVNGKIIHGSDDVPKGSYHTFNITENTVFSIKKEYFPKFQIDKIKEASETKASKVLICVFDRDEACFAILKRSGYEIVGEIKGDVAKKNFEEKKDFSFYKQIIDALIDYRSKFNIERIIVASPAFWKEELLKEIRSTDGISEKEIATATCNSSGRTAIEEVLKRTEIKKLLKEERIAKELELIENLLLEIKKEGLFVYGFKETSEASQLGAVKTLLVSDNTIHRTREDGSYELLESIMKNVDRYKGEIHLINSEFGGGKKLDGLGGIGGILRFKTS